MDDFNISILRESKNEWAVRLVTILTKHVTDEFRSMFVEAVNLCAQNREDDKYLMTFQNILSRIPTWNPNLIEAVTTRIVEKSGCGYLEDLVTCVHIIYLKLLSAVRVSQKNKKIDIDIPDLPKFIHKVFIHSARKIYVNVYLFDRTVAALQKQKNNRELELLVQESVLCAIRDNIPIETILKAYLAESVETEETVEVIEPAIVPAATETPVVGTSILEREVAPPIAFNDIDSLQLFNNKEKVTTLAKTEPVLVEAPKNPEHLDAIYKGEANPSVDEDGNPIEKLVIGGESVPLDVGVVESLDVPTAVELPAPVEEFILNDEIEVLA